MANGGALSDAQKQRYRGCYCGLCRALKARYGNLSRLTLSYDMTFLVMLLSAMYEPEETEREGRCMVHPARRRSWWSTRFTDYAADVSVALAYHNCMDDWNDERRLPALAEAAALKRAYRAASARCPAQCAEIEACMADLREIETSGNAGPDDAANRFGKMLGEIFACQPDPVWNGRFRAMGEALGRFVYMMDAVLDLEKDRKTGSYNPLAALTENQTEEQQTAMLKMLIGECTAQFEQLPILQDADILRNILYSGVWGQYALAQKKRKGDPGDDQRSV